MYPKTKKLSLEYFIVIVSGLLGLGLFIFSVYLIFYLLFDSTYQVPKFIFSFHNHLIGNYQSPDLIAFLILILPLIIAAFLLLFLAWIYVVVIKEAPPATKEDMIDDANPFASMPNRRYTIHPAIVHLASILAVFILLLLVEWWLFGIV